MHSILILLFTILTIAAAPPPPPCVNVHLIVARQSNAWPGEGRMKELADSIKRQLPSADSEALQYPAYGDIWRYRSSVFAGDKAMIAATTTYVSRCPNSTIVLLGYSQGAHIIGDILCGSVIEMGFLALNPLDGHMGAKIVAAVSMGDPTYAMGLPYNFGTSKKNGRFPRVNHTACTKYNSIRRSYCDEGDKFCAAGFRFGVHRKYVAKYKDDATRFVLSRINASGVMLPRQ
ncbi:acetylxylan esterase precursor [Aspergillus coremiiformis]|uniref:Acetylxylan esterase n=1 Tax=Aspergillus coremiiformis TaxID=138285 RepID=A0A5N6ZF85_9EURO|nr:acetylxylan esterase precursor [Aspergillus coremiiformis]